MRYLCNPQLSIHEKAHYAWLDGRADVEAVIDEAIGESVDEKLREALQDHGIYDKSDWDGLIRSHEDAQGERDDMESERDGLLDALGLVADVLRAGAVTKRRAQALAGVIESFRDDKSTDRFSYASRLEFEKALWEVLS